METSLSPSVWVCLSNSLPLHSSNVFFILFLLYFFHLNFILFYLINPFALSFFSPLLFSFFSYPFLPSSSFLLLPPPPHFIYNINDPWPNFWRCIKGFALNVLARNSDINGVVGIINLYLFFISFSKKLMIHNFFTASQPVHSDTLKVPTRIHTRMRKRRYAKIRTQKKSFL